MVPAKNLSTPSAAFPRPHPYLLTTPARIRQLRQAILTPSWQARSWQRLKSWADQLLTEDLTLPSRAGNWEHYYIDSLSGVALARGKQVGDWQ
ncbi:hypothetical protein [Hymenobacter ruricola]|uniref:Uncharacterized protein n=1 Tax=Hymenobacter ruricola TaxID=2791023 RepID=A0ABS0IB09_9BACT|nr:hypothetical protein [Hymenobacter ruricola]MBF9223664.1 hypothetical protein [Hymenobacter ruricola]